jgi:hypothetical protein
MVLLFIDNDVTDIVVQAVLDHYRDVDLVRARDVGLEMADDPVLLEWAAANERVTISSDSATMTAAAHDRLRFGLVMPGLVILPQSLEYRVAIEDVAAIALCSDPQDWKNKVAYLPLVK